MKDSLLDILLPDAKQKPQSYSNVEEITIEDFLANVVPTATSIEALVKNAHKGNLVSLVAPQDLTSKNMLKWDNNFTWSYNGDITESMKERVKSAGGKVDGVLRFSIQWNEDLMDRSNDLDAHCVTPNGAHISFRNPRTEGGTLDVDIQRPEGRIAVENITWPSLSVMRDGEYNFYVNNYYGRNIKGFRAEIEMNGIIHSFNYSKPVTNDVQVATVTLKNGVFTIATHLHSEEHSSNVWNLKTEQFQKVSTIMHSPNFWDGNATGNKHYFFMLDSCKNPDTTRGFYTEFLMNDLHQHRKVFEMLGGKFTCPYSDDQLSGLGFGSTQRAELIVKVNGTFNRMLKIKF